MLLDGGVDLVEQLTGEPEGVERVRARTGREADLGEAAQCVRLAHAIAGGSELGRGTEEALLRLDEAAKGAEDRGAVGPHLAHPERVAGPAVVRLGAVERLGGILEAAEQLVAQPRVLQCAGAQQCPVLVAQLREAECIQAVQDAAAGLERTVVVAELVEHVGAAQVRAKALEHRAGELEVGGGRVDRHQGGVQLALQRFRACPQVRAATGQEGIADPARQIGGLGGQPGALSRVVTECRLGGFDQRVDTAPGGVVGRGRGAHPDRGVGDPAQVHVVGCSRGSAAIGPCGRRCR